MTPDPLTPATAPVWMMIYLARRNPALAPEDFPQAWREHSALGRQCRNVGERVRSVTQCSRVLDGTGPAGVSDDYDGVNLLQLADHEAAHAIWTDPETLAIMKPDEPRVFDRYVREFTLVCQQQVLREAPRGAVCLVGFLRRGAAQPAAGWPLQLAETRPERWMTQGPFAACARVVHNAVAEPPPPGYDYDSICEWWFDSADAARAAFAGTDLRSALRPMLGDIADLDASVFVLTRVTHSRP